MSTIFGSRTSAGTRLVGSFIFREVFASEKSEARTAMAEEEAKVVVEVKPIVRVIKLA